MEFDADDTLMDIEGKIHLRLARLGHERHSLPDATAVTVLR